MEIGMKLQLLTDRFFTLGRTAMYVQAKVPYFNLPGTGSDIYFDRFLLITIIMTGNK